MPCQSCGYEQLKEILDLGNQPLCNSFTLERVEQKKYPLVLCYCPKCSLVQLSEVLAREVVFGKDFNYLSSSSKSVRQYYQGLAERHYAYFKPRSVLEVAGNDGVYLKHFPCPSLNVEPAPKAAEIAQTHGVRTLTEYFEDVELEPEFDLIAAFDVLAHAEKVHEILDKVSLLMSDSTVFIAQFHSLKSLVEKIEFDTIYHEHIRFFSLPSFSYLLGLHGLQVFGYEETSFYGGSIIAYCRKGIPHVVGESITESELKEFAKRAQAKAQGLREFVLEAKSRGKKIVGIGAPMKASTLLSYCRLDSSAIDYLTETNPLKAGRFSPQGIPVYEDSRMLEDRPDIALVLSWNMYDSIVSKLRPLLPDTEFVNPMYVLA